MPTKRTWLPVNESDTRRQKERNNKISKIILRQFIKTYKFENIIENITKNRKYISYTRGCSMNMILLLIAKEFPKFFVIQPKSV